jgi:hypothetical protein
MIAHFKIRIFFTCLLFIGSCRQQQQKPSGISRNINGSYFAFELIDLRIDSLGSLEFYMKNKLPSEKWYYRVGIIIKDSLITLEKTPVSVDSTGQISYSASDGGFLSYTGKIEQCKNYYIAETKLTDCDYTGISPWQEPPKIVQDEKGKNTITKESFIKPDMSSYDTFVFKDGRTIYLAKGTIKKDLILRLENNQLWVNNERFYSIKSK